MDSYRTIAIFMLSIAMTRGFAGFTRKIFSNRKMRLNTGHQTIPACNLSVEEETRVLQFKEQQAAVKRPTFAEEIKTLIQQSIGFGVLSTNSLQFSGYPTGSVVGFQTDENGFPFFAFSTMSAHTKDLEFDGRTSLTVMAKNFQGAAEGRVVLVGDIKRIDDETTIVDLRSQYRARHKDAYWIDFGYTTDISFCLYTLCFIPKYYP